MKSEILTALREAPDFVSGQELCEKLQVSRTAVWKWIRKLQEEGYEIEAVPNKGYRIIGYPDIVAAEEVESRLQTKWIGKQIRYFKSTTSTNQMAKKFGEDGASEGLLVIADEQTAGKGRSGRVWKTPAGSAVAMTVLLRPQMPPERISMVTLVMGMAVAKMCREFGLDAGIKWPNDVVIKGRKLCGILTEMSAEMMAVNYIVIGVGINVNMQEFPEEIQKIATSIAIELGEKVNRAEVIAKTMEYFEGYYQSFVQEQDLKGLKAEYNKMLVNRGREVRVLEPRNEYQGLARGIDDEGRLLVERENGEITAVYAGEVSVRGIYGYV